MNSAEFIRRIRRVGRKRGVEVRLDVKRGKGSHTMLYYGDAVTIVPHHSGDLPRGTQRAILRQIGLTEQDLR